MGSEEMANGRRQTADIERQRAEGREKYTSARQPGLPTSHFLYQRYQLRNPYQPSKSYSHCFTLTPLSTC